MADALRQRHQLVEHLGQSAEELGIALAVGGGAVRIFDGAFKLVDILVQGAGEAREHGDGRIIRPGGVRIDFAAHGQTLAARRPAFPVGAAIELILRDVKQDNDLRNREITVPVGRLNGGPVWGHGGTDKKGHVRNTWPL